MADGTAKYCCKQASVLPVNQLSKILSSCLKLNNKIKLATINTVQCRVKKKNRQWERYTEVYKVELNMKAPGMKKKDCPTTKHYVRKLSTQAKKQASLKTVACLPLSHSSSKVSIRLAYFPVFRNQKHISWRGRNSA